MEIIFTNHKNNLYPTVKHINMLYNKIEKSVDALNIIDADMNSIIIPDQYDKYFTDIDQYVNRLHFAIIAWINTCRIFHEITEIIVDLCAFMFNILYNDEICDKFKINQLNSLMLNSNICLFDLFWTDFRSNCCLKQIYLFARTKILNEYRKNHLNLTVSYHIDFFGNNFIEKLICYISELITLSNINNIIDKMLMFIYKLFDCAIGFSIDENMTLLFGTNYKKSNRVHRNGQCYHPVQMYDYIIYKISTKNPDRNTINYL